MIPFKEQKFITDQDVKGILLLKMFQLGLMSEKQVMSSIEFPRGNKRNPKKKNYILSLLKKMKQYDELFPNHLVQMIKETEESLREQTTLES